MEQNDKYIQNLQYMPYNISKENIELEAEESLTSETNQQKIENFKIRLNRFKEVSTLEEAKSLLQRTMPMILDRTTFKVGDAKCIIINSDNHLRICFDSPSELISYDFI